MCLVDSEDLICNHALVGFDYTVSQLTFSADSQYVAFSDENSPCIYIASVLTGDIVFLNDSNV